MSNRSPDSKQSVHHTGFLNRVVAGVMGFRTSHGRPVAQQRRWTDWRLVVAAAAFSSSAALGHHSVASNFDRERTIDLTGTVAAVHLRNPHSQYVLNVPSEDGREVEWLVEWSDRNALVRRKVDLSLIQVGDVVTITVWPSRRLRHVGFFVQALLSDGSMYRDCGFLEFRRAVATSTEYSCAEAEGR